MPPLDDRGHTPLPIPADASVHNEQNIGGRSSMSSEMSLPMSASSSSTSSNPIFTWPTDPSGSSGSVETRNDQADPFNNTNSFAEDPFAHPNASSESDDDLRRSRQSSFADEGSVHEPARRGPTVMLPTQFRATSLPGDQTDYPIDPELAGAGPPMDEFPFQIDSHLSHPAFNRTFSAPLPSRLGHLQHPITTQQRNVIAGLPAHDPNAVKLATSGASEHSSSASGSSPTLDSLQTPLHTLSLELADSLQSAIQTLLHLSPPHLLDNAKEQYSGCTVQMPTTSLSALLTSMRSLNYLSANIEKLCAPQTTKPQSSLMPNPEQPAEDFDIGELLQSVADLLSGQSAQSGVDLVLFHGDVGIKHVSVKGDGQGLGYLLSHVIRQILLVASPGDTIELGLQIIPQSPSLTPRIEMPLTAEDVAAHRRDATVTNTRPPSPGRTLALLPPENAGGPLLCVFEIVHNMCQSPESPAQTPKAELNPFTHLKEQSDAAAPKFDSLLCRRLLQQQRASLKIDAQPSSPTGTGLPRRAYELTILLPRGKPISEPADLSAEEEAVRQPFPSVRLAREPTLAELSQFAESLRGKKVVLHASLNSVFARHLTSYLGAWGLDVSHAPLEEADDPGRMMFSAGSRDGNDYGPAMATEPRTTPGATAQTMPLRAEKFIIVDDDVAVLRRELARLRAEVRPLSFKPQLSKRPTLLGRAKSTSHVRQVSTMKRSDQIIIHFTSLANFNQVRDVISSLIGPPWATHAGALFHPDVMVIPKPVGPRRFLTALHTAVYQPVIDPFFAPIATSPRSPGGGHFGNIRTPTGSEPARDGGFFDTVGEEGERSASDSGGSLKARSPLGEFPPSQPIMPSSGGLHLAIPTPGDVLATPASEYFSSTRGPVNAASGIVMQSPDGRPFGMFFEPPPKIENRRGSVGRIPSESLRRKNTGRRPSGSARGEEPTTNGSPSASPQQTRRISTVPSSTPNADESNPLSRRSSGGREIDPKASAQIGPSVRGGVRRSTLPANGAEPILAIGRDRSSTVTSRKRITPATTPVAVSPKTTASPQIPARNTPELPAASPASSTRIGLKRRSRLVERSDDDGVVVPPINVLIVEDNPINQNILAMFLRKKKIKYQSAKDGLEAVEKWRTGGFHLILMDIQLPVMDGIEATKEIRKLERNNNIGVFPSTPSGEPGKTLVEAPAASPFRSSVIIVALTASSLQSDRVVALAAGCNDFLTKPVSLKWLERKIVEWGCMQALIDFDGWRRWHSSDNRDANETKRGFQVGPQQAAKSLASRLRIERRQNRSPGPVEKAVSQQPAISVQVPTPDADGTAPIPVSTVLQSASQDLQSNTGQTSTIGQQPAPSALQPALPKSMSLMSIHEDIEPAPNVKTATLPDLQA